MKKFFALIFAAALLVVGCSSEEVQNDLEKVQKIGTIKYENVTEEAFTEFYKNQPERRDENLNCEYIFFDNMVSMTAALKARQIDMMSTYESVARYLVETDSDFKYEQLSPEFVDIFCCAMREEDAALKKEFDNAILKMTNDGTLSKLVKNYIAEVYFFKETPPVINMPVFYNDTMITVGVTGDLPMLDYIRPDGSPAGFNTAVLAEISKRIGKNFLLVQIDSGARAVALASKKVDVIFWAVVPQGENNFPQDFDKPEGVILTEPYFSDEIVHVKLR